MSLYPCLCHLSLACVYACHTDVHHMEMSIWKSMHMSTHVSMHTSTYMSTRLHICLCTCLCPCRSIGMPVRMPVDVCPGGPLSPLWHDGGRRRLGHQQARTHVRTHACTHEYARARLHIHARTAAVNRTPMRSKYSDQILTRCPQTRQSDSEDCAFSLTVFEDCGRNLGLINELFKESSLMI